MRLPRLKTLLKFLILRPYPKPLVVLDKAKGHAVRTYGNGIIFQFYGRRHVNFSEWGTYPIEKSGKLLEEICKEVREGDMPPLQYMPMHGGSKLTKAD